MRRAPTASLYKDEMLQEPLLVKLLAHTVTSYQPYICAVPSGSLLVDMHAYTHTRRHRHPPS